LAVVGTTVIAFALKAVMGLRPSEEVELGGLDLAEHGEEGYHSEGYAFGQSGLSSEAATPAPVRVSAGNRRPATT
jgi:hypothetical protein